MTPPHDMYGPPLLNHFFGQAIVAVRPQGAVPIFFYRDQAANSAVPIALAWWPWLRHGPKSSPNPKKSPHICAGSHISLCVYSAVLDDQHRITITIESILFFDRFLVRFQHQFVSTEGTYHDDQARLR